jgi:twitching motility two-component system response regulator PilG
MPETGRILLSTQPTPDIFMHSEATNNARSFPYRYEQASLSSEGAPNLPSFLQHSSLHPKLVMTIDDSATVRKIIEVSLRREGLEVVSYPDGIEALQAVANHHLDRLPDLVVLDLDLPQMNGFEIARYLRAKPQWSQTAIVILSRHDGIIDRLKARLAGAQAYMTKPFTTQQIVAMVQTTLETSFISFTRKIDR